MHESCCTTDLNISDEVRDKIRIVLWIVLIINLGMFFVEISSGLIARSSTLIADSLDMLADSFVYGLSLFVLNKHHTVKAKASLLKGILMLLLGVFVIGESVSKILYPVLPTGQTISLIGLLAIIANGVSLLLLWKYRSSDLNLKSAWICSRNDTLSNVVVILAGFLVLYFQSMWPDIIVGLGMAGIVIHSSVKIIIEALEQIKKST